jgi:shikimate dehydrogenase
MNAVFEASNRNAICLPFEVSTAHFEPVIHGLKAIANLDGLVITVPHKPRALGLVDRVSAVAQRVGAINVMRRETDGRWLGDMFDGTGLVKGLMQQGFHLRDRRVKQMGTGGAGAAVAHALAEAGVASLELSDPRREVLSELVARLRHFYPACNVMIDENPDRITDTDLLLNCSPVGMSVNDGMPVPFGDFPDTLQVVDIIMTPAETPLLKHARQYGCKVTNGLPMIYGQLEAFAQFFGLEIPSSALPSFNRSM